jgi:short-subunit dehydrogenase involved in D-alanine esterification of teichoic acids
MAGIQKSFFFSGPSTSIDTSIISEVNINVTEAMFLTRLFFPHLAPIATTDKPANLLLVSSDLAFMPPGFYPVYCPTKAAIHPYAITVRQQLTFAPEKVKKNFSICEIAPPYVDTGLDAEHREQIDEIMKGRGPPSMGLEEYMEKTMKGIEEVEGDGKLKKEVGTGSSQMRVDGWWGRVGKVLEGMGIEC